MELTRLQAGSVGAGILVRVDPARKLNDVTSFISKECDGEIIKRTNLSDELEAVGTASIILGGLGKREVWQQCLVDLGQDLSLIEALGEAPTEKKSDSCRFGKYIKAYFVSNRCLSSKITVFGLEAARVLADPDLSRKSTNYSTFDIFYQLAAGGRLSGTTTHGAYKQQYDKSTALEASLSCAGLLEACVGIKLCSALDFVSQAANEDVGKELPDDTITAALTLIHKEEPNCELVAHIKDKELLTKAAAALGVNPQALIHCLTHRTLSVGGTTIKKQVTLAAAIETRNAMAKQLYGALFKAAVHQFNKDAATTRQDKPAEKEVLIVDLFRFDGKTFNNNGLQQLFMNLSAETVRYFFAVNAIEQELELYKTEGCDLEKSIRTPSVLTITQSVKELIEKRIFNLLDAEIKVPGASDQNFCAKLYRSHRDHQRLQFERADPDVFLILHSTVEGKQEVRYSVSGMVNDNRVQLNSDVLDMFYNSTNAVINIANGIQTKAKQTNCGQLMEQLSKLKDQVLAPRKQSLFVFCVKMNTPEEGRDTPPLQQQLDLCLEAVRVRRYPYRLEHLTFYRLFWHSLPKARQSALPAPQSVKRSEQIKAACGQLILEISKNHKDIIVASTMVSWTSSFEHDEIYKRRRIVDAVVAVRIQAIVRRKAARALRLLLRKVSKVYNEISSAPQLHVKRIDTLLTELGEPSFESRELRLLRKLKVRLRREPELEREYIKLAALPLGNVDMTRLEALVSEGRDLELDSLSFQKLDHIYATVVEKRQALATIHAQREVLLWDDTNEEAVRSALRALQKLVRIYGRVAMSTPEQAEAETALAGLEIEDDLRAKLLSTLLETTKQQVLCTQSDNVLEVAISALRNCRPRRRESAILLELTRAVDAQRRDMIEALRRDDKDGADGAWEVARARAAEALATSERLKPKISSEVTSAAKSDARSMLALCEARSHLVAKCRTALTEKPLDESKLQALLVEDSHEEMVEQSLGVRDLEKVRLTLEGLREERRLVSLAVDAMSEKSASMLETAVRIARAHGVSLDPAAVKKLEAAAAFVQLRQSLAQVEKTRNWNRREGTDFLEADDAARALAQACRKARDSLSGITVASAFVEEELKKAETTANEVSVRDEIRRGLEAELARFNNKYKPAHDFALGRLRRAVNIGRTLTKRTASDDDLLKKAETTLTELDNVLTALEAARRDSDVDAMESAIHTAADELNFQGDAVQDARKLCSQIKKLLEDARVGCESSIDRDGLMRGVVKEARRLGLAQRTEIQALEAYLQLPEHIFLLLVLSRAIRSNRHDLAVQASLRLHELYFIDNSFDLADSPALKTKTQYAGLGFSDPAPDTAKRRCMAQMLCYGTRLESSLTLNVSTNEAKALFRRIVGYMGDALKPAATFCNLPEELAEEARTSSISDEALAQVFKQLSKNPGLTSRERGWKLLEAILAKGVAPSSQLVLYAERFVREHAEHLPAACVDRSQSLVSRMVRAWLDATVFKSEPGLPLIGWLEKDPPLTEKSTTASHIEEYHHRSVFAAHLREHTKARRHFFVFDTKSFACYKTAPLDARGRIDCALEKPLRVHGLSSFVRILPLLAHDDSSSFTFPFIIHKDDDSTIVLSAYSAEERASWLVIIGDAISSSTHRTTGSQITSQPHDINHDVDWQLHQLDGERPIKLFPTVYLPKTTGAVVDDKKKKDSKMHLSSSPQLRGSCSGLA